MYKSYKKTVLGKIVDIVDFYLCEIYDILWGWHLVRMPNWNDKTAIQKIIYKIADWLPPTLSHIAIPFKKAMFRRKIRRVFGK